MKQRVSHFSWLLCLILLGFWADVAFASCGSAFCPIITTPEGLLARQLRLDLSYEYIDQNSPFRGTDRSDGLQPGLHREIRTLNQKINLRASYGVMDRLTLDLHLPFIIRHHEHTELEEEEEIPQTFDLSGIGDLTLIGRYAVLASPDPKRPSFSIGAGVKFPTGPTDIQELVVEDGETKFERAEPSLQPGTGSWDPIFGLYYLQKLWQLTTFANATYRISTGHSGYKFGDELLANVGVIYPLKGLDLLAQVNFQVNGRDKATESPLFHENTGGTRIFMSPGLRVPLTGNLATYLYVQIPIYRNVNGVNLTSDWNLLVGLTYTFGVGKPRFPQ